MDIRIINPDNIELKGIALKFFNAVNAGEHEINIFTNYQNDLKDLMFTPDNSTIKLKRVDEHTYKVI
jgi:hypothetical protein